ncbi:MAG: hypothetical protein JST82_10300 [Bacteroidetes bacterium]|nr:hypothetical protein [Bacteroidota bacterium]
MEQTEQKRNIKAAAWTISVHALLLVFFLLFKYTSPASEKPVQELGMEVNLGTDADGSGTEQPMITEDPAPDVAATANNTASQESDNTKDILKTDEPDAPSINNATTETKKPAEHPTEQRTNTRNQISNSNIQTPKPQQQRPRYVYNGSTGRGGNSASTDMPGRSEGNTHGRGDRGVPGGTPGAANYTGTPGSGNGGISHTLSGRNIIAFPPPNADFREGGKVVIRITVNRDGQIVNRQVKSSTNSEIRNIALHKLDKVRFNKSEDAPEEQFGEITFVFKTRS